VTLDPVGTSFRQWASQLTVAAVDPPLAERELPFWQAVTASPAPALGVRPPGRAVDGPQLLRLSLPTEVTASVLTGAPAAFHGQVNDVLLAALAVAVARWRQRGGWTGSSAVLVDLEGHGREEGVVPGADLSRTVGWFTSIYPVRLDAGAVDWDEFLTGGPDAGLAVKRVKEQLRAVPAHGIGYGLLRYLNQRTGPLLAMSPPPQLGFNYLGRFGSAPGSSAYWQPEAVAGGSPLAHPVEVNAVAMDSADGLELHAAWSWDGGLLGRDEVTGLAEAWFAALRGIAAHVGAGGGGWTPSDVPLVQVSQEELDELEADL
jgi:non-ribosomal peptide synthase protein (TIGR01720 family)